MWVYYLFQQIYVVRSGTHHLVLPMARAGSTGTYSRTTKRTTCMSTIKQGSSRLLLPTIYYQLCHN